MNLLLKVNLLMYPKKIWKFFNVDIALIMLRKATLSLLLAIVQELLNMFIWLVFKNGLSRLSILVLMEKLLKSLGDH